MDKRTISLLIISVMLLSVVPATMTVASANASTPQQAEKIAEEILTPQMAEKMGETEDALLPTHGTGLIWVPLDKYEGVTGNRFSVMNDKTFREALINAPFYPRKSSQKASQTQGSSPSAIVNTLYLPPIGDQGWIGSCTAWSSTYYVWTYMINWWRNNPHPETPDAIMNPTFTYNLINGGEDAGSNMWDAMNLISTVGAVSLNDFPLYNYPPFPEDYLWVWPNLTQWMLAPHNKGTGDMYIWQYYDPYNDYKVPGQWYILYLDNDTQWQYLKGLLDKGYIMQTAMDVLPSFQFLNHPESFTSHLQLYSIWATDYAEEFWANQSYANGEYTNWTVGQVIDYAHQMYNEYVQQVDGGDEELLMEGNYSVLVLKDVLSKYNVSMSDKVYNATKKIQTGIENRFINNQTWQDEANYYLSTYSINGEEWFVNHGFVDFYVLHNLELMIHHIPVGDYIYLSPFLNFYTYYQSWSGGHAVTIIGYDDMTQTPDGQGALAMVNSWSTGWGNNGYWLYSYGAARNPYGDVFLVDNMLPLRVAISYGEAFVYVPKAADYKPKVMGIVGIKHPVRGEVIDGLVNSTNWEIIAPSGIPLGFSVGNETIWEHDFLDFWIDYNWGGSSIPQAHPFPNSPMAFDVSDALDYINYYINQSDTVPSYLDFYVNVSDKIQDNIIGTLYNFTLDIQTPNGPYYVPSNVTNITIPDGGWTIADIKVPLAQYASITPANGSSVNYGNFAVDVITLAQPKSATVIIANKTYELTAENNGYYFYGTSLAQKLKLPAGTYNYTVLLDFGNNKTLILPSRTVTIKGPAVQILSPKATIYNTTQVQFKVNITTDGLNITTTAFLDGKAVELDYNSTSGLYEASMDITNGIHTFKVGAVDEFENSGSAIVQFAVSSGAKIKEVSNVTVGGRNLTSVTVENETINATIQVGGKNITVEVPIVNNIPAVLVNTSAIEAVADGESNVTLAAGWNTTVNSIETITEVVKTENGKKLIDVKLKANVKLGENGVAVIALRDINISKVWAIKEDGSKILLTTNRSNGIGYYYRGNGTVFVVLKEDPIIEADGYREVPVKQQKAGISMATLNFLYYRYYENMNATFNKLYQEALNSSVDKLTLSMALHYHEMAMQEYKKALELSGGNIFAKLGDPRLLSHLRKAYLHMREAVEILKQPKP